jgi:hypothetical protein
MAMPDKLPFTALAGIIAAAVKATSVLLEFYTAVTWSLVILAAAIETVLGYTSVKRHWPTARKRITVGGAILIAAIVVGLLDLHAYRTEFLKDDVRVNFQGTASLQTGRPSDRSLSHYR